MATEIDVVINSSPTPVTVVASVVGTGGGGGRVIASQAEAEAGTENTKGMTPLRTAQAIAALETGGAPEGTAVLSTGETGGSKFLREDGDGTSSWQAIPGGGDMLAANNLSDLANAAIARTNLDVDQAGIDNSTDVTLAGTPDYITISGQEITRNQIDLTTDVTGNLPTANVADLSGVNTGDEVTATTTTEGVVELATQAETNAGTAGKVPTATELKAADYVIPAGGTTGQIIKKNSNTDYDVSWGEDAGAGGGISNIVEDTMPKLGGQLDVNGQAIGDGTRELVTFVEDASAVNHLEVENEATGSGPILRATGDDTNVDLELATKGSGVVNITGNLTLTGTVDGRDVATDGAKLDGIEDGADVTDTTNVTAAGALMDSEVDADIKTLALPANTTISAFGATLVDDADAATARTTLGVDAAGIDNSTDVTLAGTPDYLTIAGQVITRNQIDLTTDVTGNLPTANVADLSGVNTGDEAAASTTVAGVAELATDVETSAGSDATRTVTPDGLAASRFGSKDVCIVPFESDTDVAVGDGKVGFCVPLSLDGMNLVDVTAAVHTAGTTGTTDVQIRRRRASDADMLLTELTIDSGDTKSKDATTAHTIGANDDVEEGDLIYVDVDAVSTTAPKGLSVTMTFRMP